MGVPLRFCSCGSCKRGEPGREDFIAPLEAWYIGSDGVEAPDMLACPRDCGCAAVERGRWSATSIYEKAVLSYCIESAKKRNAMDMQGYHKKGARKCAGIGVVLRLKGHLDIDSVLKTSKHRHSAAGVFPAAIRRPGRIHAFHIAKSFDEKLRKTATCERAACNLSEQHHQQHAALRRIEKYHSIKPWQSLSTVIPVSSDGAL